MNNDTLDWILAISIIVIAIFTILLILRSYRGVVRENGKVNNEWNLIDENISDRFDVFQQLLLSINKASKSSKERDFQEITKRVLNAFTKSSKNRSTFHAMKAERIVEDELLPELSKIQGKRPEITSNKSFINLKKAIERTEQEFSEQRKTYNNAVLKYNDYIDHQPNKMIAKIFKFENKKVFMSKKQTRFNEDYYEE